MRRFVNAQEPAQDVLGEAAGVIAAHGVVAFPTETFYGLAVSVFDARACERVFVLKGRPASKALPCIVSDVFDLEQVAREVPALALELSQRFWPGPLTLVLPARSGVAAAAESGTIAVRVSSLPLARELAAAAGPVTSTSANPAGAAPATTADEVELAMSDVDLILDGGRTPGGLPSTIVAVSSGTAEPRLIREGAIPFREIVER